MEKPKRVRTSFIIAAFLLLCTAASNVLLAILLQRAIDSTLTGSVNALVAAVSWLLGLWMFDALLNFVAPMFKYRYLTRVLSAVKQQRMTFLFYNRRKKPQEDDAKDLSFFTTDTDILETSYYLPRLTILYYAAEFLFALTTMLYISWVITVVIFALTLLPVLSTNLFSRSLQARKKAYSESTSEYVDVVRECIQGKREIIAYDKEEVFLKKHEKANNEVEKRRYGTRVSSEMANRVAQSLGFLTFIAALSLGGYFVMQGTMTYGYMIAVVQLMNSLVMPINMITTSINAIRSAKGIAEKADEVAQPDRSGVFKDRFTTAIEILGFGFSYETGTDVIDGLNLRFERGKKYAVTAPSGFGKTTLAKALSGEYDDYQGIITMDGIDIRSIDKAAYHHLVRFVRQDSFLFTDTVRNNIAFFDEIPDDRVFRSAITKSQAADFLPNETALSRTISDRSGLSGGQKQRIALSRALLHLPSVLILDEITAGVDIETAVKVLSGIFADEELTCIVITHETDPRLMDLFDEVIQLEQTHPKGPTPTDE
ncbi:MAG: ABC transporter ATP-binding protein [Bacillota bacterium]